MKISPKRFKMTFSYRYIQSGNRVICFAMPRQVNPILLNATKLAEMCQEMEAKRSQNRIKPLSTLPPEFKGIATFKEGDKSNIEQAKKVAKLKAIRAAYKAFKKLLDERINVCAAMFSYLTETSASLKYRNAELTEGIKAAATEFDGD